MPWLSGVERERCGADIAEPSVDGLGGGGNDFESARSTNGTPGDHEAPGDSSRRGGGVSVRV